MASINCQQHTCAVIIDAGSTGSRIHIYSYDKDKTNTPYNIQEVWSKKLVPGFGTLQPNNQVVINHYLENLFAGIPENNLPVYFFSTGGMRLLPQEKQQEYYSLLKNWFNAQEKWKLKSTRTITGKEEGLFGWLAVNYQLGTLTTSPPSNAIGVLDMGGASVQIMFPLVEKSGVDENDVQQFSLYGQTFTLFIHSFLGLGQTEVIHQFLDQPSCFANDYLLPSGIVGNGDALTCKNEISALVNNVHHVDHIVQSAIERNSIKKWFVLGGMNDLAKSKPFQFEENQFTSQNLLEQANTQVCQQSWSALNAQYASNYLYSFCLTAAYYSALITDGYGLSPQQQIIVSSGHTNDWTLGAILVL